MKNIQIVGIDAHACGDNHKAAALLYDHIVCLRANPFLKDATLVMLCERNTGHESGHLWDVMCQFPNTACYREPSSREVAETTAGNNSATPYRRFVETLEDPDKNPGFHTGPLLKMTARETLENKLYRNELYVLDGCVSGNPHLTTYTTMESKVIFYLETLVEQMSRARVYPTRMYDGKAVSVNYTWSAKVNEEDKLVASFRDDLVVILALVLEISVKACNGNLLGFPYEKLNGGQI